MNKYLFFIALLMGTLLLVGCCSTTGKVSESGTQSNVVTSEVSSAKVSESGTAQSQSTNIENAEVGKTYTINYLNSQYEVTLTKVEFTQPTNEYATGYYLMSYFEIKNIGDKNELLTPDIYAIDSTQEKYDQTIGFMLDEKYEKSLELIKKLSPGTKMSGWVAIKVPKDTAEFNLYFEYTNMYLSSKPNYIKWKVTKN